VPLELLNNYHYSDYRTKTLQYIREKSLLSKDRESEDILLNIILIAEISRRNKSDGRSLIFPQESRSENGSHNNEENDNIYKTDLPDWVKNPWIEDLSPEFLDQAAMLVEKLRMQSQDTIKVVSS
jgi:hypothetical protein